MTRTICSFFLVASAVTAHAMQITGYSQAENDLYSSGYPTAPVRNTSPAFIGLGFDWSGVGWKTTDTRFNFGALSPQHFLSATHVGNPGSLRFLPEDGALQSANASAFQGTGQGLLLDGVPDIAVTTLSTPIAASNAFPRYGVLDLNASSTTDSTTGFSSPYDGLSLFVAGFGGSSGTSTRVGAATIQTARVNSATTQGTYFTTTRNNVQLEAGDSGSPVFHAWINPNGGQELALIGNNAAISPTSNFMNFLGTAPVMNALNTQLNATGWALRIAGNPTATWQGGTRTNISDRRSWGLLFGSAPSDTFVLFDGPQATSKTVNVNTAHNLRGLYFKGSAAGGDGFTFSGTSVLTIGRGGITNYDADTQMFLAPLRLGDSQIWDGGSGGLTVSAVDTNGRLLEVQGSGENLINGAISGSGSLAVSNGHLTLSANNSYTGKTWVHAGQLTVNGSIASSLSVQLASDGRLSGVGIVSGISGSGAIEPGSSAGILTTPSVNPTGGLDFYFEFNLLGSPDYALASDSGNDVLRLTGQTPFAMQLGAANRIHVFLGEAVIGATEAFRGGIFADQGGNFIASISGATFLFYEFNATGEIEYGGVTYSPTAGDAFLDFGVVQETANFANGSVDGWVLEFTPVPEPGTVVLLLIGGLVSGLFLHRAQRC